MSLSSTTVSSHEIVSQPARQDLDLKHNYLGNDLSLMNDLRMAREVQRQLLQREMCDAPGVDFAATCVPARELGGDFYDLRPYGTGHLALALGDVSGKGTAAALLGALTIGILRTHTVNHSGCPSEVLAALNNYIVDNRLDSRFVVMLFAALDINTRRLTLANAGCPYPLLLRKGRPEEIKISGVPLGLFEDTRYDSVSLDLRPGEVLVFASDGILECENREEETFGAGRVGALLNSLPQETSAEVICSAILGATSEFARHASAPDDDRSILVLRLANDTRADSSAFQTIAHRSPTRIR
jgi:sigma-B regulation protein RsbU (phosphoserine phosphatase)